jgi:hypothetical protein
MFSAPFSQTLSACAALRLVWQTMLHIYTKLQTELLN